MARAKEKRREGAPADFGALSPAARAARGDLVAIEEMPQVGARRARVRTQSMLDRYLQRGQVTQRQFDAGEQLHRLWRASGQAPKLTASYAPRVTGAPEPDDRQAALRSDLNRMLGGLGSRQASILVHVCLCDAPASGWGERHRGRASDGIAVLRLALDSLADAWGLPA